MMAQSLRPAASTVALRNAARGGGERFLVGLVSSRERKRVAASLANEGTVLEAPSTAEALRRLADEPFDLAILDLDERTSGRDPLAASRELRPFMDLVLVMESDPERCGDALTHEVTAVLPRPLPEAEALLRAHLRWLASCRRSRTRGLLVRAAFAAERAELLAAEPTLASALEALTAANAGDPQVTVLGDAELAAAAGGRGGAAAPDVVVVSLAAVDALEVRMQEARARAAGSAIVVVDGAPSPERLRAATYGGARAYLARSQIDRLGRVVASTAARRHAESGGRKLVEALARFGVLDSSPAYGATEIPAAARDVDPRLIAEATAGSGAHFVPTGHEVLVVDDEAVVLTVLREALRRGGYRVTTAPSAEEAMELMRARRFDLVLTDKNLPGASGLDVLRAARGLDPPPAIVLITGYGSFDSAAQAMDLGVHDYIEKPVRDVEDLRFRIRRALSRRDEQLARPRYTPTGGAGRVLLVEEEGARSKLIADYLGKTYQVTTVRDGDEALVLLQKERYDVVLADRNLPGVSGLRVIEQAQRLLPHCASVLYTAYPSYDSVKEAFDTGVDAYLVRPSDDLRKLGDKVAEALGSRGGILLG